MDLSDFKFKLSPLVKAFQKRSTFDIEANGLLKDVTVFFCAVVEDVDNGDIRYYRPDEWQAFLDDLYSSDWIIGHNIIGYDIPALTKMFGWLPNPKTVIFDTVIASRMYNPNLEMHPDCPRKVWSEHSQSWKKVGPHTLMNLGYIVGCHKDSFGEEKAFNEFCEEMLTYCAQDVRVNVEIFKWLRRVMKGWSDESIMLEMEVATYINEQMRNGWAFNIEAADALREDLENSMAELEEQVRSVFGPIYKPKTMVPSDDNPNVKVPKVVQPKVTKAGKLSSVGIKNIFGETFDCYIPVPEHRIYVDHVEYYSGAFTPVEPEEFNLGSRQQIAERMIRAGWVPTKLTDKGNVIINDDVLESLGDSGIKEGVLLQKYFKVSKIHSMVCSWIEHYDWDTGAIHGYVNSVGAVTSRMTHSNPNVAQVPASKTVDVHGVKFKGKAISYGKKKPDEANVLMAYDGGTFNKGDLVKVNTKTGKPIKLVFPAESLRSAQWNEDQFLVATAHGEILLWGIDGGYGADCRHLFFCTEGRAIVGCDASGLELRCLAHYMNDEEYTDLILHGDIHTHNQHLAGLPERKQAKTFIYAFLYGAGNEKIGSIVNPTGSSKAKKDGGAKLKAKFLKGLPKLKNLLDRVAQTVEARGATGTATLKGLDGRRIRVRSPHAALNTLLQSCGAIVMKLWLVVVMREVKQRGLDVLPVGNIHDEGQFSVRLDQVDEFVEICEAAFPVVAEHFNFRCPLAGEAKVGESWAYTH